MIDIRTEEVTRGYDKAPCEGCGEERMYVTRISVFLIPENALDTSILSTRTLDFCQTCMGKYRVLWRHVVDR